MTTKVTKRCLTSQKPVSTILLCRVYWLERGRRVTSQQSRLAPQEDQNSLIERKTTLCLLLYHHLALKIRFVAALVCICTQGIHRDYMPSSRTPAMPEKKEPWERSSQPQDELSSTRTRGIYSQKSHARIFSSFGLNPSDHSRTYTNQAVYSLETATSTTTHTHSFIVPHTIPLPLSSSPLRPSQTR